MNTFESLFEKINNAKALDFGDIISRTIELFKKVWLQGFLLMIILCVVMTPLFVAIYMPMYTSLVDQMQNGGYNPNDANNLLGMQSDSFRYKIMGLTFIISFITTALVAAFYKVIRKLDNDEVFRFSDFFQFFRGKYFDRIFAIASFSLLIALLNFAFEKFLSPNTAILLNLLMNIILSIYTTLFVVFFAFNPNLKAGEFFSLSFNLGSKKWFLIFGLLVVTGLLACLGFIACGLGVLFTVSIVYLPVYFVYKDVVGFNEISDIDQIGKE